MNLMAANVGVCRVDAPELQEYHDREKRVWQLSERLKLEERASLPGRYPQTGENESEILESESNEGEDPDCPIEADSGYRGLKDCWNDRFPDRSPRCHEPMAIERFLEKYVGTRERAGQNVSPMPMPMHKPCDSMSCQCSVQIDVVNNPTSMKPVPTR